MEKEFIGYNEALTLKELGFDEPCFVYWVFNNVEITFSTANNKSGWSMIGFKNNQMVKKAGLCTSPTFSQAFRWFREKYGLYHSIGLDGSLENDVNCDYQIINHSQSISENETDFKSYEEAELACLKKLIEICRELK
jgi:hypothetical protein